MRISDWSSDVCSSDLDDDFVNRSRDHNATWRAWLAQEIDSLGNHGVRVVPSATNFLLVLFEGAVSAETVYRRLMDAGYIVRWLPGARKSVVSGKRVSVRVDRGGRRHSKKKK